MLQTVEAIYDPYKGLMFSENVTVTVPIKVLVTFVEPCEAPASFGKGSGQALLAALKNHPLPESAYMSDATIEAQIQELGQSWEM